MKKKELIDGLVSEIETGKVKTLGIYGHGHQVNQPLPKTYTKP